LHEQHPAAAKLSQASRHIQLKPNQSNGDDDDEEEEEAEKNNRNIDERNQTNANACRVE
jgi:hypothetical protein